MDTELKGVFNSGFGGFWKALLSGNGGKKVRTHREERNVGDDTVAWVPRG